MTAFQDVFSLIGASSPNVALLLAAICALGELTVSIPYLLESIWLLSGYELAKGLLSPVSLGFFWLSAQLGRQTGAFILFYLSRHGSVSIRKYFQKRFTVDLSRRSSIVSRIVSGFNRLTPLSVAAGRLFYLRVPLTMALGASGRFRTLVIGIILSSLVFDGIYILLGSTTGVTRLEPAKALLYFLVGLTILYASGLIISRIRRSYSLGRNKEAG